MLCRSLDRRGLALTLASLVFTGLSSFHGRAEAKPSAGTPRSFHFHHEGILGTSLDLVVRTDDAEVAVQAEQAALTEIERLRRILSTYDPTSEVSRFNQTTDSMSCSAELIDVLTGYNLWAARSHGAFSGQMEELIHIWKRAEKIGAVPDCATLARAAQPAFVPGWTINAGARTATRRSTRPVNLDSLGKGYIIGRAAAAIRVVIPTLAGFLINLGGDIFVSGAPARRDRWRIGIAHPTNPADNAFPLTEILLADGAVSTSGTYERGYCVAGRRYSHIIDPRTGFPAEGIATATVVASDNATANALATTLCVLKPDEGLGLVRETPGAECLIVAADGEVFRSAGFAAIEVPATGAAKKANEAKPSLWPKDFQMTLTFTLKAVTGGRGYKRPYVAIWVEDEKGKRVRTIAVWGNNENYFPDLHDWYYGEKDRPQWALSIARATRPAGRHRVVWDGRDDSGNPLPRGTYTIALEANREHGTYAKRKGTIVCGAVPAAGLIRAASEFEEGQLSYGPPGGE